MPELPLPPLPAIRAFEAAARHGNFTAAGEELGLTQAAVSYQIKQLEDRVGLPLFLRRARGVTLTADGARLAERAGEALEILRDAFAEARHKRDEVLEISALPTFAAHVLAPRLGHFQIAHPQITTRIELESRITDILGGESTVAIRSGHGRWEGLRADFLIRSHYAPMLSPAVIDRYGMPPTPGDLRDLPLVDPDDPGWTTWFSAAGLDAPEPAVRSRGIIGTQILTAQAMLAGQGAGLLTPAYFSDHLARGEMVQPFDIYAFDEVSIWLAYPERRRNAPALRAFRDWLLGEMVAILARAPAEARLPVAPAV